MKMKRRTLLGCLGMLMLSGIVVAQTDATADRLQWFHDAKFGMFIHFGVDSKSEFNPVDFDAGEWARVAKEGGMKYVVLTTKHHAGFCLWDSALTEYNVVDQTPYPRDIVKDLAAGCKAEGLKMGCYYSIADYHHPLYEPKYQNRANRRNGTVPGADITKYIDFMFGQLKELCELYRPCLIWFDGGSGFSDPAYKPLLRRQELVDMLHSYGTLSNSRLGDDDSLKYVDYLSMNDNMAPSINLGVYFESAVCMGRSWNFRANDTVKSPKVLLAQLVNIVGNGGNYLLNVGPDENGVIPKEMQAGLKTMGSWLKENGDAIYGTEAGPYRYAIDWGSITQRKDMDSTSLYLNVADWPTDGKLTLFGVNNPVLKASLLATGEAIKSDSTFDGASGQSIITLAIPKEAPDEYVSVIKLVVAGTVSMDPAFMQLNSGKVIMNAYNATIHDAEYVPNKPTKAIDMKMFTVPDRRPMQPSDYQGPWDYQMYKKPGEGIMPGRAITVSGLQTKGQALTWDFKLYTPGTYEIVVNGRTGRSQNQNEAGKLRAHVAGHSVEGQLDFRNSGQASLGTVHIDSPGTYTFTLEVAADCGSAPRYGSVMLAPVTEGE